MTDVWPDVEGGLRTWLRTRTAITAIVGQRVFFGAPDDADESDYPMLVLMRVGGGNDPSEAPIDISVIQFDCLGPLRRKDTAFLLAAALRSELSAIRTPTTVATGIVLYGAEVDSVVFLADPADKRPRYALSAQVTARSS